MTIEKDGKVYTVRENKTSWTVSRKVATAKTHVKSVTMSYIVPKDDCSNINALKVFISSNELF